MVKSGFQTLHHRIQLRRGMAFGAIIISALLAFELFNYSTTEFALNDLLGNLSFIGLQWSTILAIAFCGIDFAGIARIFTPEEGADEPKEVWYLFGAWLLAATMNAMLTWWGISIAILQHESLGNAVIDRATLLDVVPIFVAVLVWLSRVLLIGTFSVAGERLFSQADLSLRNQKTTYSRKNSTPRSRRQQTPAPAFRPARKPSPSVKSPGHLRPEPTYHPISMSGTSSGKTFER